MACSTPPIYWPTGIHFSTVSLSKGLSPGWLAKRMKYQLESTNVSSVSVSRRAAFPHLGHSTCFHVGRRASGLPGIAKLTSSGSTTRSEEHPSELHPLMRTSYSAFCLKQNK